MIIHYIQRYHYIQITIIILVGCKLGQKSGQVFGDSKSKKATTNCVGSLTCTVTDNTIIDVAMIINIILMNKVFAKLKCLLAIHAEGMQRVGLHDHKN